MKDDLLRGAAALFVVPSGMAVLPDSHFAACCS